MLERYERLLCSAPWDGITVHWTGLVFPCCSVCEDPHAESMLLGDLTTHSLTDILNSEKAWKLREAWTTGKLGGTCCEHCHVNRVHTCNPYFRTDVFRDYLRSALADPLSGRLKRDHTTRFPLKRIEIQISSPCQYRCSFCNLDNAPTGSTELRRKGKGYMDPDLFDRLLDEFIAAGGSGAELYTHWTGEPLLHPQKERIYRSIGDRESFWATIVTNGVRLNADFVNHLLSLKRPPGVYLSLHAATPEAYKTTTKRGDLALVKANFIKLLQLRKASGRSAEMPVFLGYTIVPENLTDLEPFVREWTEIFAEYDEPPAIQLNGRGKVKRNTLIIVANGNDPENAAMREAFWTLERLRSGQEPSITDLSHFAGSDDWKREPDPKKLFIDYEERLEQCLMYSASPGERDRFRSLLLDMLLRHSHYESEVDGVMSNQTAGRIQLILKQGSVPAARQFVDRIRRGSIALKPTPEIVSSLSKVSGVDLDALKGLGSAIHL